MGCCCPLQPHFVIQLEMTGVFLKLECFLLQLKLFIPSEVICQNYFPVCLLDMSKTGEIGNQITLD